MQNEIYHFYESFDDAQLFQNNNMFHKRPDASRLARKLERAKGCYTWLSDGYANHSCAGCPKGRMDIVTRNDGLYNILKHANIGVSRLILRYVLYVKIRNLERERIDRFCAGIDEYDTYDRDVFISNWDFCSNCRKTWHECKRYMLNNSTSFILFKSLQILTGSMVFQ